jgi:hypothetical protein
MKLFSFLRGRPAATPTPAVLAEYGKIREEIRTIQDCITEYVKRFFEVGVLVTGAIWYLQKNIPDANKANPDAYAYVYLLLSYIILAFAGILFHKFNTHNRYAGYARTLAREMWPADMLAGVKEIHIWESVLEPLDLTTYFNDDLPDGAIRDAYAKTVSIRKSIDVSPHAWTRFLRSCAGIWMIIRSPLRRVKTNSWTYPYNIGFVLFFPSVFLLIIWLEVVLLNLPWFATSSSTPGQAAVTPLTRAEVIINVIAIAYLLRGWLGMGYRMFRLCDDEGDRTIAFYNKDFQVRRWLALKARNINVTYVSVPG